MKGVADYLKGRLAEISELSRESAFVANVDSPQVKIEDVSEDFKLMQSVKGQVSDIDGVEDVTYDPTKDVLVVKTSKDLFLRQQQ